MTPVMTMVVYLSGCSAVAPPGLSRPVATEVADPAPAVRDRRFVVSGRGFVPPIVTGTIEETGDTGAPEDECPPDVMVTPPKVTGNRRLDGIELLNSAWWTATGSVDNQSFGNGVRAADFDGDGASDLVVGTMDFYQTVLFGPLSAGTWYSGEVVEFELYPQGNGGFFEPFDGDGDGQQELMYYGDGNNEWWVMDLSRDAENVGDGSSLPRLATLWIDHFAHDLNFSQPADFDGDGALDMWTRVSMDALLLPLGGQHALTLVTGPISGTLYPETAYAARYLIDPLTDGTAAGAHEDGVVVGDLDGTGTPDLAIGVAGDPSIAQGGVVVVQDPPVVDAALGDVETSRVVADPLLSRLVGTFGLIHVGDMNGDGYGELAFTAGDASPLARGAIYLQYGPPPPGAIPEDCVSLVIESPPPYGGIIGLLTGDLDGDGTPDLLGGGDNDYGVYQSTIWYGPLAPGTADIDDADAIIDGADVMDVADFDADGIDDLVLSDIGYGSTDVGAVYILQGGLD